MCCARARALAGRLAHSMNVTIGSAAEALAGEMREHLGVEPGGLAQYSSAAAHGSPRVPVGPSVRGVPVGLLSAASMVAC